MSSSTLSFVAIAFLVLWTLSACEFSAIQNQSKLGAVAQEEKLKPNVILIVLDDLNDYIEPLYEAFDLGNGERTFIGHPQAKTPHIMRLAEKGTTFTRAYANNPICSPSRASFLYGIHPHKSKNAYFDDPKENTVLKNSKSMMEHFKSNGYTVRGTGKVFHKGWGKHWDQFGVSKSLGPVTYYKKCSTNEEGEKIKCHKIRRGAHPSARSPFRKGGALVSFGPFVDLQMPTNSSDWHPTFIPGHPSAEGVTEKGWIRDFPSFGSKQDRAKDIFIVRDPRRPLTPAELAQGPVKLIQEVDEDNNLILEREVTTDEKSANYAVGQIKKLQGQTATSKPLFLAVGFMRPHAPFYAPRRNFDLFPLEETTLPAHIPDDQLDTFFTRGGKGRSSFKSLTISLQEDQTIPSTQKDKEKAMRHYTRAYLATVNFVDEQIGQILDAIEAHHSSNPQRETIVVLMSDHGYHTGQKDYNAKDAPWEQTSKVPLIIWKSGQNIEGSKVSLPVSLIDLYPTLNDLAGLKGQTYKNDKGRPLDGGSLRELMDNPHLKERTKGSKEVLTMVAGVTNQTHKADLKAHHFTLRSQDWRYIQYKNCQKELYYHGKDHSIAKEDPNEWYNLADDTDEFGNLIYQEQLDYFGDLLLKKYLHDKNDPVDPSTLPTCD